MKKLIFMAIAALLFTQSCSNAGSKSTDSVAETTPATDTVATVQPDSTAAVKTDTVAAPKADSEKKTSANSAKIDKLLKKLKSQEKEIRQVFYPHGKFDFSMLDGYTEAYLSYAAETCGKLKKLQKDMTPEQKAEFDKTYKSVKKLAKPAYNIY